MTLHIFQSTHTPEMYGFTVDPSGANLPADEELCMDAGTAIPLSEFIQQAKTGRVLVLMIGDH